MVKKMLSGTSAVIMDICCGTRVNTNTIVMLFCSCFLSEHQAALLQLKRECKEELEKLQVSVYIQLSCGVII